MNDDQNHDLERTISRSLEERAARAGGGAPSLDAVFRRVEQRRRRRRGIAVAGSAAIVVLGIAGVTTLGSDDEPLVPAASPDSQFGDGVVPAGTPVWRCENPVFAGFDASDATYYEFCEQVPLPADGVKAGVPVTTAPGQVDCAMEVPTTVPMTVPASEATTVDRTVIDGTVPTVIAGTVPCATIPPVTTTTSIPCEVTEDGVAVTVAGCSMTETTQSPAIRTAVPSTTTSTVAPAATTAPPTTATDG